MGKVSAILRTYSRNWKMMEDGLNPAGGLVAYFVNAPFRPSRAKKQASARECDGENSETDGKKCI